MERAAVDVHSDYRVYATELINFLSTIIRARVKNLLTATKLSKNIPANKFSSSSQNIRR